jgi:hypothetical protein
MTVYAVPSQGVEGNVTQRTTTTLLGICARVA